jgi:hypothetical protein
MSRPVARGDYGVRTNMRMACGGRMDATYAGAGRAAAIVREDWRAKNQMYR